MLSSNKNSFLQSLVLLILTGKLIKITPCPFLPFVQWTWLYEHYKKHSLACVLHRLQRQQTCPTCTLDVISGAPAAWPKPPQPTKVYEDCLSLLSGCIQQADCSLTKEVWSNAGPASTRAPQSPLPGQNQAAGQLRAQCLPQGCKTTGVAFPHADNLVHTSLLKQTFTPALWIFWCGY